MLVLSRKLDEVIVIGEKNPVKIKILGIRGGQVRIGIDADRKIPVNRQEVCNRAHGVKKKAVSPELIEVA